MADVPAQQPSTTEALLVASQRRRKALEDLVAQEQARAIRKEKKKRELEARGPIWERSVAHSKAKELHLSTLKAKEALDDLKDCTFAPQISERSREIAATHKNGKEFQSPTVSRAAKLKQSGQKERSASAGRHLWSPPQQGQGQTASSGTHLLSLSPSAAPLFSSFAGSGANSLLGGSSSFADNASFVSSTIGDSASALMLQAAMQHQHQQQQQQHHHDTSLNNSTSLHSASSGPLGSRAVNIPSFPPQQQPQLLGPAALGAAFDPYAYAAAFTARTNALVGNAAAAPSSASINNSARRAASLSPSSAARAHRVPSPPGKPGNAGFVLPTQNGGSVPTPQLKMPGQLAFFSAGDFASSSASAAGAAAAEDAANDSFSRGASSPGRGRSAGLSNLTRLPFEGRGSVIHAPVTAATINGSTSAAVRQQQQMLAASSGLSPHERESVRKQVRSASRQGRDHSPQPSTAATAAAAVPMAVDGGAAAGVSDGGHAALSELSRSSSPQTAGGNLLAEMLSAGSSDAAAARYRQQHQHDQYRLLSVAQPLSPQLLQPAFASSTSSSAAPLPAAALPPPPPPPAGPPPADAQRIDADELQRINRALMRQASGDSSAAASASASSAPPPPPPPSGPPPADAGRIDVAAPVPSRPAPAAPAAPSQSSSSSSSSSASETSAAPLRVAPLIKDSGSLVLGGRVAYPFLQDPQAAAAVHELLESAVSQALTAAVVLDRNNRATNARSPSGKSSGNGRRSPSASHRQEAAFEPDLLDATAPIVESAVSKALAALGLPPVLGKGTTTTTTAGSSSASSLSSPSFVSSSSSTATATGGPRVSLLPSASASASAFSQAARSQAAAMLDTNHHNDGNGNPAAGMGSFAPSSRASVISIAGGKTAADWVKTVGDLTAALGEREARLKTVQEQLASTEGVVREQSSAIASLEAQCASLRVDVEDARKSLEQAAEAHKRELDNERKERKDEVARLHSAYESELANLSMKPSHTQVQAYGDLSERFIALEKERAELAVSESTARRELQMLKEEVEKIRVRAEKEIRLATETCAAAVGERAALQEKAQSLSSEVRTLSAASEERLSMLTKEHERALSVLKREHEATMESLTLEHQRAARQMSEARAKDFSALQAAMEEKVGAIQREKEEAVSALKTAMAVEVEKAIAATESKAAVAILTAAASAGIHELQSPRRGGIRFPTSPEPKRAAALLSAAPLMFGAPGGARAGSVGASATASGSPVPVPAAPMPPRTPSSPAAAASGISGSSAPRTPTSGSSGPLPYSTVVASSEVEYAELLEALAAETAGLRQQAEEARAQTLEAEARFHEELAKERDENKQKLALLKSDSDDKVKALETQHGEKLSAAVKRAEEAEAMVAVLETRLHETSSKLHDTVRERDALGNEQHHWSSQAESANIALRSLFSEAREAKERLLAEMTSLAEDRASFEVERAALRARENQLIYALRSRGLPVPPVASLGPAMAQVLQAAAAAASSSSAPVAVASAASNAVIGELNAAAASLLNFGVNSATSAIENALVDQQQQQQQQSGNSSRRGSFMKPAPPVIAEVENGASSTLRRDTSGAASRSSSSPRAVGAPETAELSALRSRTSFSASLFAAKEAAAQKEKQAADTGAASAFSLAPPVPVSSSSSGALGLSAIRRASVLHQSQQEKAGMMALAPFPASTSAVAASLDAGTMSGSGSGSGSGVGGVAISAVNKMAYAQMLAMKAEAL